MHTRLTNRERFLWTVLVLGVWAVPVAAALLLDLVLALARRPTISHFVWEGHRWLGWVLVGWLCGAPVFLFGHFFLGWFKPPEATRRWMRRLP